MLNGDGLKYSGRIKRDADKSVQKTKPGVQPTVWSVGLFTGHIRGLELENQREALRRVK